MDVTMKLGTLPRVEDADLPDSLRDHVAILETKGIDTTFHRYMAHSPLVADFYWRDFYLLLFAQGTLPRRTKELVRLVLAAISGCPFCRANDIESALANGLTQPEVEAGLALDIASLEPVDALVAGLAQRMSPFDEGSPLGDDDWKALRSYFDDDQVAELLMCISVLAGVGRMLVIAGFIPQTCDVNANAATR
ncbi:MAG: carboxymuconolactone decarboxylase family protein [Antricoccus sp.]